MGWLVPFLLLLPRTLDLTVHPAAETGWGAVLHARFVISTLEVGREMTPAHFDLLEESISHVWDEAGRKMR